MEKEKEYVTKTEVKEEFGLTERMIGELLPAPLVRRNPHSASRAMYLWEREKVREICGRPEVRERLEKAAESRKKKRESLRTSLERRKEETGAFYEQLAAGLQVERIGLSSLRRAALEDRAAWYEITGRWEEALDVPRADEETVERWMVNYVRHCLTSYDGDLEAGRGRIGNQEAQAVYADILFRRMEEVYPELSREIGRQRQLRQLREQNG